MEVKPKRPRFNSRRGSQAQLVRAPDYVRHFQNVRHLQWRSSLSSAMSIFSKVNNNLLTEHWLCAGQASHEHKLVWYFTIILAPFIQNSLGYYKLEYNANVSEAEESNRLQANFPLSQSRESRTLFSSAIRQAIDRSLQSGNICTLSTSRNHPTACIGMLVMNPPTAHMYMLVILCHPDQTHQQLACICFSIFAAYIWNCYSWTMQKPFDIVHSCTLPW